MALTVFSTKFCYYGLFFLLLSRMSHLPPGMLVVSWSSSFLPLFLPPYPGPFALLPPTLLWLLQKCSKRKGGSIPSQHDFYPSNIQCTILYSKRQQCMPACCEKGGNSVESATTSSSSSSIHSITEASGPGPCWTGRTGTYE